MENPIKTLYDHIRDNHGVKIPECELEVIINLAQKCPEVKIHKIEQLSFCNFPGCKEIATEYLSTRPYCKKHFEDVYPELKEK